uniref:Tyrosine-protein kinase n=1 Tax=Denticeps clupeoides TaxID=299321 RepID=A0AAY4DMW6_9TELE
MDATEEETAPLVHRERGGSHRTSCGPGLQVKLYFLPVTKAESSFSITAGQISAEDVCIKAAATCGILPVFHSLFALASEDVSFWYPPTHVFSCDEGITVHYRVRFFFSNWFGQGTQTSCRYGLTKSNICAVLDYCVIDYLFAQVCHSDSVNLVVFLSPPLDAMEECLGMAVLDLWRMAKERNQSLKHVCKYKSCLPETHRQDIQKMSRLARYQIRKMVWRCMKRLRHCSASEHSLKLKYLMELAAIEPSHGTECFLTYDPSWQQKEQQRPKFLRVSGETGIQTRETFCDFPEIIDMSIKRVCHEQVPQEGRVVTLTLQDDRRLELEFQTLMEALSFVSLVDGYFRLTTDSSHFFCQEVAPPSLLKDLKSHCHGPITSEFAVQKLKRSGAQGGTFLVRHSPREFSKYFLTVCVQTPFGKDYKDCLIVKTEQFVLLGVHSSFPSLTDLVQHYQQNTLLLANIPVTLGRCCPPRPKGALLLVVMERHGSPSAQRHNPSHIQFQMIRHEELECLESLGQGSFTRVFLGRKKGLRDGEGYVTNVLLKVLDSNHKNCWELCVCTFPLHLSDIMVQEFVKFGALDLYLKRGHSVSVSWKLEVAKQLACALIFLEEKNIVHGNICAKNLLLAREGDQTSGNSPFIKLSDPGISLVMLGQDVLMDRIPWVAPEVLEDPEHLELDVDKWSFGTTLWEIFSGGKVPLQGLDLHQKLQFYKKGHWLPRPDWTELADLICQCMNYQPELRPSCRTIIRQLNGLITSDYEILHAAGTSLNTDSFWRSLNLTYQPDQAEYEERHLRYISPLGKGNFGSVELCRYDPLGDNTGELVAVKRLQPNKQSNMADFQREIRTISSLHCDYIVKYRGICYSMGRLSVSLVMEYLPYGSLIAFLEKKRQVITPRRLLLFASQICKGMEYLQSRRVVHRDLAARNILVASDSLVKIADFGLTKIIPSDKEYYRVSHPGESPIFWYAPESITDFKFSHKSDVWSFGVVLYEIFSFCNHHLNPKVVNGSWAKFCALCTQKIGNWRLPAPQLCPPQVYSMMTACWAYESENRPTFSSLGEMIESYVQDEREGFMGLRST